MSNSKLERGLAAGFGAARENSVLRVIERITGEAPRILLRDEASEAGASPMVDVSSSEQKAVPQGRGSYQLLGEIARGGMGVVMKGHDTDLGRDVALKVLHKNLAQRPEVVQRFVEEAQIGGQLQHPGIVPVYELGLMADERPYFTMKLVKGRTLAVLLSERKLATAERRKLLDVFESVCQTLAYAHSRGVIHRDLKPANVMVGAFGEVQVVDWGLAKVLASGGTADEKRAKQTNISIIETVRSDGSGSGSHSQIGSVMGTPAYMPPEQARGEIDKVNERSDVFSLGAILCEILTGLPPYVGESEKTIELAAKAQLDDATKRLDGCAADADLIALAKECLAPAQQARPRDAGIVAQRIHDYLTSVEERARDAQVDAAEARVKAAEERKARKLTLALGSSVLVTVLVVGGGWAWMSSERASRERETEAQVNAALSEATLRRGEGKWAEALAAVERAQGLAASGAANAELRSRVAGDVATIENDAKLAREKEALDRDNAALMAELEDIRQPEGIGLYATDYAKLDQAFATVFEKHGLFLDRDKVEEAVAKLSASGDPAALAAMVFDWDYARWCARNVEGATRLGSIVRSLDRDETRDRLRVAVSEQSVAELKAFAARADLASLPASSLNILGRALFQAGALEESAAVYRQACGRYPGDFVLARNIVWPLRLLTPPATQEAVRHLTAALALRPKNVEVRHMLGALLEEKLEEHGLAEQVFRDAIALSPRDAHLVRHLGTALAGRGDVDGAIAEYRKSIQLDPTVGVVHGILGDALRARHQLAEAVKEYELAIQYDPNSATAHIDLGNALSDQHQLDRAIDEYRNAILLEGKNAFAHNRLGEALLEQGKLDAAIEECTKAVALDPQSCAPHNNLGRAWAAKGELDKAIAEYQLAIERDPKEARLHSNRGGVFRRKREFDNALKEYNTALLLDSQFTYARVGIGRTQWDQGKHDEALATMRAAVEGDDACADAHSKLAWLLERTGDGEGAKREYQRALDLDSTDAYARDALRRLSGDVDYAEEIARNLGRLRVNENDAYALGWLAWNLATCPDTALRNGEKAVEYAERGRALAPNDSNSFNNLGAAYCCAGRWADAIVALNRSIELNRATGEFAEGMNEMNHAFLALAHANSAQPDKAHEYLDLAAAWHKAHPNYSDAPTLGLILEEARAAIEAAEKK